MAFPTEQSIPNSLSDSVKKGEVQLLLSNDAIQTLQFKTTKHRPKKHVKHDQKYSEFGKISTRSCNAY